MSVGPVLLCMRSQCTHSRRYFALDKLLMDGNLLAVPAASYSHTHTEAMLCVKNYDKNPMGN